ncbi:16S rRNA (uracil(1498)-N(3))-methyltransferase [Marinitenerispora sediminis]|uniref:Ribosomal RNA small subunit methyltransferase E n=1 Tax=Marinitenerispora sediminis TaxID=1931232 RepID=A0A368SZB5_9ACTN|nr:16S rRNA (uracil(1498)-N(3))-methyltransferase [Marinitenerispora sediminis]RCV50583.1 16S rRNA (uracil(1498)-N(3))-methyltransferase [Marinitenerispora sediminis]RCV50763.1 16S rRNA (uracil(1498)-N(3))-methyltransferase [Marinitenerispora sediminis]RCV54917.1 16S rRNA (uracil(1498)-N(3))-methyltransferase [Marinitenerispora sediminis]
MTPPVFLTGSGDLDHDRVVLAGPEGRHAATVRRLRVGETVDLADGAGTRARCVVTDVGRDTVAFAIEERHREPAPAPRMTVVQALPKGDRGELAVEVMTEAGVDAIVPWSADRCVTRWKPDRVAKSLGRWRSAAREAAKQARRSRVPEVTEPTATGQVAALLGAATLGIVLHEETDRRLSSLPLPDTVAAGGADAEIVLVVGPEGGFTDAELAAFDRAGAVRALLGPSVLRTSTAGVAALAVLQARCGRW